MHHCDEVYKLEGDRTYYVWDYPDLINSCKIYAVSPARAAECWAYHALEYHDGQEAGYPRKVWVWVAGGGPPKCFELECEYTPEFNASEIES